MKIALYIQYIIIFLVFSIHANATENIEQNFNKNWQFVKDVDTTITSNLFAEDDQTFQWESVSLPHTAHIEPLVIEGDQWQGYCFYRKFFNINTNVKKKHIAIRFDGIMQEAEVWVNGSYIGNHIGGYLPYYVDLTNIAKKGENCIVLRVNNLDNSSFAPGKPIKTLDFCYFSGIYRNATLLLKDKIYISDPIQANRIAQGGLFFKTIKASKSSATAELAVDINNDGAKTSSVTIETQLINPKGEIISTKISEALQIEAGSNKVFAQDYKITDPYLWSPETPNLYTLSISVLKGKKVLDQQTTKVGIRTYSFNAKDGFVLNDKNLYLRGTNRHQEYPYIGNALSDNAQYRDAYKIKMAGFNFVRLSHYPQSSAFMKACDELGLLIMNCISGWQYFGKDEFQKNALQDVRDMVRRDRNHPSVVLWEASLNESRMSKEWMDKAHQIVKKELPGVENYTCGWMDYAYDVFIPARQHGKAPNYWKKYSKDKPTFIAEYGDWEYYAQNAGFNQTAFSDLQKEERTSRQLREHGQIRLAQQALNYQEAHNDNLYGPSLGDANWLMFDYNRGYANDIESSGIMDIFRLPKFAHYFYQSQKDVMINTEFNKPMIYVANLWNDTAYTDVKVYSNCNEVELYLNNKLISRKKPDKDRNSVNLPHPPFSFSLETYTSGTLTAKGYINGVMAIETEQSTAKKPHSFKLEIDESGKVLEAGCNDVVFVYAKVVDMLGNVCWTDNHEISFEVSGDAELIGQNPIKAEAGIATILLKAGEQAGDIKISVNGEGLKNTSISIQSK